MITRFKEYFLQTVPEAASRGVSVLMGVSGGADSIAMAALFMKLNLDIKLAVAHVNFSLRGEASDGDQAFVESWCAERGLKCYTRRFDTYGYASQKGISIEMAARELRYEWFAQLSVEEGFEYIAVAHNQNDNVETMFLNLVRGTGLAGIAGMKPVSGNIIRPMLRFSRQQIESYCTAEGLEYREDASNADVKYHRNRVRHNIFPELSAINPSFLDTIERDMGYFSDADSILSELAPLKIEQLTYSESGILHIRANLLKKEKHRAYWLYRILEPYGFNSDQVSQISLAIDGQSGKRFYSKTNLLVKDRDLLKVYPAGNYTPDTEYVFEVIVRPSDFNPKKLPQGVLATDADSVLAVSDADSLSDLASKIKCRGWLLCDKFKPLGMKGCKLVSDFFNDIKLDIEQKKREAIVTVRSKNGDETIVAIASRRIDDRFKVTDGTTSILLISPRQCSQVSQ